MDMVNLSKPRDLTVEGERRLYDVVVLADEIGALRSSVAGDHRGRVQLRMASLRHRGVVVRGRLLPGQFPLVQV